MTQTKEQYAQSILNKLAQGHPTTYMERQIANIYKKRMKKLADSLKK